MYGRQALQIGSQARPSMGRVATGFSHEPLDVTATSQFRAGNFESELRLSARQQLEASLVNTSILFDSYRMVLGTYGFPIAQRRDEGQLPPQPLDVCYTGMAQMLNPFHSARQFIPTSILYIYAFCMICLDLCITCDFSEVLDAWQSGCICRLVPVQSRRGTCQCTQGVKSPS